MNGDSEFDSYLVPLTDAEFQELDVNNLQHHDWSFFYPQANDKEQKAILLDMHYNGMRDKIVILNGKILKGRTIYNCQKELYRDFQKEHFLKYTGSETEFHEWKYRKDILTKHLNSGQKACLAVFHYKENKLRTREELRKKISDIRNGIRTAIITEPKDDKDYYKSRYGTCRKNISQATILYDNDRELYLEVLWNKIKIHKAYEKYQEKLKESEGNGDAEDKEKFLKSQEQKAKIVIGTDTYQRLLELADSEDEDIEEFLTKIINFYKQHSL